MVAWRGGLPTTKLHLFNGGPGARFVGLEIHGVPQAPLSWPPVGADTNCEARWSSLRRLLGVAHGEGGRSSPPGPGELGRIPGSFTGGQDWGIGPRSLPPPPSPSPPERMAEGYPQLPVPAPLLPRLGIVPICSFLFSAFPILSAKEGWPLWRVVLHSAVRYSSPLALRRAPSSANPLPSRC